MAALSLHEARLGGTSLGLSRPFRREEKGGGERESAVGEEKRAGESAGASISSLSRLTRQRSTEKWVGNAQSIFEVRERRGVALKLKAKDSF